MTSSPAAIDRAVRLVSLFSRPEDFGVMQAVDPADVPQPHRGLLDHSSHMTVAMERFYGGRVTLQVVATRPTTEADAVYAREILLLDQQGALVQYGIVRIDLGTMPSPVAERIEAADAPLGRVLVDAGCLCEVQSVQLVQILPGPHLAGLIGAGRRFGRVAAIVVDGRPAIELLEVVAAVALPHACREEG